MRLTHADPIMIENMSNTQIRVIDIELFRQKMFYIFYAEFQKYFKFLIDSVIRYSFADFLYKCYPSNRHYSL